MHGGLSGGIDGQGFPLITQLVTKLSECFDLTVYSLATFSDGFNPVGYRAYCVPAKVKTTIARFLYLTALFFRKNKNHSADSLYSFWGYPMGTFAVVMGRIVRRPSIVNILGAESANVSAINYGHMRRFLPRKTVLWTCKKADKLIAVSNYQLDQLKTYGFGRAATVIPWGVDRNSFFPVDNELASPLKFIHVGNLTPVKDQATLVKAFARIREEIPSKLKIVGPDFFNGTIQDLVHELGLTEDVEFVGFVHNRDIIKHYHWANAFILTSLSEGQNNSITEAMMCGLLPISTRVGIMNDLENTVGIVEDIGDYESIARSTIELYLHPNEWKSRCAKARKWAMTHDLEWTVGQLQDVIKNTTICTR